MAGEALLPAEGRVLFRIEQRNTGVGGRMGIVAVDAVDPLHGVVGVSGPEAGGADVMTLQADLLPGSAEHEFIVLGMGIMTFAALSRLDRRMERLRSESLS